MRTIVPIVEGDGEVQALPVLLRRVAAWKTPEAPVTISRPIRVRRDRFLNRDDEFEKMLALASAKAGTGGAVLVVLDADDDCPASLGPALLSRVSERIPQARSAVVLANREYESWFLAAAQSLNGVRGFSWNATNKLDAETPRDAKGWIRERTMAGRYSPVVDQAAFSQAMDLGQAHEGSRSFRKLVKEWLRLNAE